MTTDCSAAMDLGEDPPVHRSLLSSVWHLLSRLIAVLVLTTAVLTSTETSFAQVPPSATQAQQSCDNANSGMYDLTSTAAGSSLVNNPSVVGAVGYVYTFALLGAVLNSNVSINGSQMFLGDTSGTATYLFATLIATSMLLDIYANSGGRLTVRCTPPGSTAVSSPLSIIRDQATLTAMLLYGSLFNPFFTANQTVNLLMGQTAEQARLLGLVRKYIYFEDILEDVEEEIDRVSFELRLEQDEFERLLLLAELDALNAEADELDFKAQTMYDALLASGVTDAMIDEVDRGYRVRNLRIGQTRLLGTNRFSTFYSPNPLSQASGPLAAFSSFGNGGSTHATLVDTINFSLWSEVGVVHQLANGAFGQSGFAAGLKLGGALRVNDRLAIGADLAASTGSFGQTSLGLTGDFTQYGLSVTPVLRLTDELFFSVTGSFDHFMINQSSGGVTASYAANKYGLSARLAGAYWYEFFLLEPDASINYDLITAPATTASNGTALPALNAHTLKLRLGGRLSASTIPIWGMPSVSPYVSAHGNWLASSAGGANYNGPSVDLGAGVTVPLSNNGSLGLGVGFNNIFLPVGTNISANASLNGSF